MANKREDKMHGTQPVTRPSPDQTETPHQRSRLGLSRRALLGFSVTTLATAGLLVLLFVRLLGATQATSNQVDTRIVGQQAPDFTVNLWNGAPGQTIHLAALRGKPVVVNFFASWCDPCQEEAPVLQSGWEQYKAQGVVFVGVAFQDSEKNAMSFLRQNGDTYPVGPDANGSTSIAYGVLGVPETVFIDRSGKVVAKYGGALDQGTLDQDIARILK